MRIPSFTVQNERSINVARCDAVPRLMVIAGPNGSGKSTLLNAVRSNAGFTNVIYVGPHRAMRKQVVQQRYLQQQTLSLENLFAGQNVPQMEGMRIFEGQRDPWGYDEMSNYLKFALCQIEVDRGRAITSRVDRDGGIPQGSVPDAWQPFKELTNNLLPHMTFERIDATDRSQVRALFRVHRLDTLVDIDDLSSGEKSVIQMFYPLIERRIKALVTQIEADAPAEGERPEICVLIDEPELHLHPNLQIKVLDYMRVLTTSQNAQVIVATHSPTIVESATFDELFLLRPVELVQAGDNQLVPIAHDEERLATLRALFGSTNNLTAMQPVIIVEGAAESDGRVVSDRRLYRALHPAFDRATLISGGGKSECIALLRALAPALAEFTQSLRVVALLDRDMTEVVDGPVTLLPVSMIENFLLDPEVIFDAIESVIDRTGFHTVDDVQAALDQVITACEPSEVDRRTAAVLQPAHFYPGHDTAGIAARAQLFAEDVLVRYAQPRIVEARQAAQSTVADIQARQRRREEFDGKKVLREFVRQHLGGTTLSRQVFAFYAAKRARRRRSVVEFFDQFFEDQRIIARPQTPAN